MLPIKCVKKPSWLKINSQIYVQNKTGGVNKEEVKTVSDKKGYVCEPQTILFGLFGQVQTMPFCMAGHKRRNLKMKTSVLLLVCTCSAVGFMDPEAWMLGTWGAL